ncbi:spore germination protein [Paenibacillus piri]|uniref:Spore germination protein n=1 Tax=Paenibacillus piri TaxID=2547395 RepID=A0A4V2ZUF5_9BACL|nr:spore germination protein [Paenibacillus piri]TDG00805.1 spore germination protein [Paenibacillus piri]
MNLETLRESFKECEDIIFYRHGFPENLEAVLVYCRTLCDEIRISNLVMPELIRLWEITSFSDADSISAATAVNMRQTEANFNYSSAIFSGKAIIWFPNLQTAFSISIEKIPNRTTEPSNIDVSIRGPKDGLIENIDTNVGLIRKRLPTSSLALETYTIGSLSETKVGLMYLKDKLEESLLMNIRQKLQKLQGQVEDLSSATQLEEIISDNPYSFFPLTAYSGRADFIVACLLKGRFIILLDGVPGAVIAPATLGLLLKTPEDLHFNYISASFGRILRIFSLVISIYLPSFFVALTGFHQDQIPFPLLATIVMTRLGIPLSSPMEMFLILILLETFKEAGYRLPSMIGQTLTVVGGLIIGDAAIRAGLTSPSMVVVGAISIVAGSTLISQTLSGTVSVLRYFNLLLSSLLGMYGFMCSLILITVYLSSMSSFGIPYLAPVSPISFRDIMRSFFMLPRKLGGFVPTYLRRKNKG